MQLIALRMVEGRVAAGKMQKVLKQKILKGCLEGNIVYVATILKCILKKIVLILQLYILLFHLL